MQAMEPIAIRLDEATRQALNTEARRDDRKPTALARMLIREGLQRRGLSMTEIGDEKQIAGAQGGSHAY